VFPDPPEGYRRVLDLVAKVPTRRGVPGQRPGEPEQWLALMHVEIESPDKATPLRSRMFWSYANLRQKYGLPVLPIGVFLRVGLDGIGVDTYEEHFWEHQAVRFQYMYVGLPALDGLQYVQGENWLGWALAALMKIPPDRVAWLGAEALRRIVEAPLPDQKRFLLGECVQAYLPLDEQQQREFERLIATDYRGVQSMNQTMFEKGEERVMRANLREVLEERFGLLPTAVVQKLQQLPLDELPKIKVALRASSLRELGLAD
jgi:hypothetical protein